MTDKPDIVLLVIDSLRADRLSCYGYNRKTSPNIDRLAKESILFEQAISSGPWTLPSHASLFTGLSPSEHGATDQTLCLDDSVPTLAEILKGCGYDTVAFSPENGWLSESTNLMKGFGKNYTPGTPVEKRKKRLHRKIVWQVIKTLRLQKYLAGKNKPTSQVVLEGIEDILTRPDSSNPTFIFANLMGVHMPYRPSKEMIRKFCPKDIKPEEIEYLQNDFRDYRAKPASLSERQIKLLNALYDASVATVDKQVSRLLKVITEKKTKRQTLLVITSDHGECIGEHGLLGHWLALYDTLLCVPLILHWPEQIATEIRVARQVKQRDLFFTLLDVINYDGRVVDSKTIKDRTLLSAEQRDHEVIYIEDAYPEMNLGHIRKYNPDFKAPMFECAKRGVRTEEFKYIQYDSGHEELFDLKNDPSETNNILSDNVNIASDLRKKLQEMKSALVTDRYVDRDKVEFDDPVKSRLEDMGYL